MSTRPSDHAKLDRIAAAIDKVDGLARTHAAGREEMRADMQKSLELLDADESKA